MSLISEIQQAFRFYEARYDTIASHILKPGCKVILGEKSNRHCRFCRKSSPEASFRMEAHAIPELLGNKALFSYYECDACNELFGQGIENDFGNWSKPMRTLTRIRGKKGVPTIQRANGGWRIEGSSEGLSVRHEADDPAFSINEDKKELKFCLMRDPYTPVAVLKTFVKIGLTPLPNEEVRNYEFALDWIRTKDHSAHEVPDWTVVHTFKPGVDHAGHIWIQMFRRKHEKLDVPYMFYCIMYGSEMFQVFLPTPEQDQHIRNLTVQMPAFPNPLDYHSMIKEPSIVKRIDLTGNSLIKDDVVTPVMTYGDRNLIKTEGSD